MATTTRTPLALSGHTDARQKELGAFYTPRPMADVLVRWCLRAPDDTMVDPSFGGVIFLESARDRLIELGRDTDQALAQVCGIDADPVAIERASSEAHLDSACLIASDFFEVEPSDVALFDANIGNPPYVRYQNWDAKNSRAHTIAKDAGAPLTKLASLWAPFIVHGCRFLKPGGRMGQVLPAEILHAQYAAPVVQHLVENFSSLTLVMFKERVFPGALEEIVLLFAEGHGQGPAKGIGTVHVKNLGDLDLDAVDGKGDGYLDTALGLVTALPKKASDVYKRLANHSEVTTLGDLATVGIGVVTGANAFFVRTEQAIADAGYDASLFQPIVGKAADVQGAMLNAKDIAALAKRNRPTRLLVARPMDDAKALATIRGLIEEGEKAELHLRYKCRIRDPWWAVPLPKVGTPDAFLTYMSDAYPRLVANTVGTLSTNTIHNVVLTNGTDISALTVAFYNSLTLLSAELVGRSYGGGLLKLEPTEAARLLIPAFKPELKKRLNKTDKLLRAGDIDAVIEANDKILLEPLGLSKAEIKALRDARADLLGRRRARGQAA